MMTPSGEEVPMTTTSHELDLTRHDWTVDKVANLPEDLWYELIEGRLVVSPAPKLLHGQITFDLVAALKANQPEGWCASGEMSVTINTRSELRPDAVVVRDVSAVWRNSPIMAADVLLAVEIISPSSRYTDPGEKKKLYAYAGIPSYWIIDTLAEHVTLTQYRLGANGAYEPRVHTADRVTLDDPWPVTINLPAWTGLRYRKYGW
jgi:Uma2 family endonuclease